MTQPFTFASSVLRHGPLLIAAAYLGSPRRIPFNPHGLFRHYPELDGV